MASIATEPFVAIGAQGPVGRISPDEQVVVGGAAHFVDAVEGVPPHGAVRVGASVGFQPGVSNALGQTHPDRHHHAVEVQPGAAVAVDDVVAALRLELVHAAAEAAHVGSGAAFASQEATRVVHVGKHRTLDALDASHGVGTAGFGADDACGQLNVHAIHRRSVTRAVETTSSIDEVISAIAAEGLEVVVGC